MKHVLIPTDLTIRSLRVIHGAVARFGQEPLRITCMHALHMPTSITDLMMLSRRSSHYDLLSSDFRDACEMIRNRYASVIQQLQVQFLHGSSRAVFRHFLEYHGIDVIVCAEQEIFVPACSRSYDPAALIKKSPCPVYQVPLQQRKEPFLVASVSELFETT